MFYKIEGKELVNTSNVQIDESYIEIDLTDEQVQNLNDQYDIDIIRWKPKITKWERALAIEAERIEVRKTEIREYLGNLVAQKSGMVELGEDVTDIEAEITALKEEYKTL